MDDIYEIASAYQDNPSPKSLGTLLTAGIPAFYEHYAKDFGDYSIREKVKQNCDTFKTNDIARYLGLNVIYYIHSKSPKLQTGVDMLNAIFTLYPKMLIKKTKLEEDFVAFVRQNIDNYKKIATESVITDCSPIVPYMGTIKKVFGISIPLAAPAEVSLASVTYMEDYIRIPSNVQKLLVYAGDFICTGETARVPDFLLSPKLAEGIPPDVLEYCMHSYIFNNPNISENGVYESISNLHKIGNFDRAYESLLSLLPETVAENELLMDIIDDTGANKMDTNYDRFDLTALMNFILSHRRFRANHWTNSAFGNLPNLASVSFYKDFMLIRPASSDNNPVDYLYVPVVDDLSQSNVVVIKYWMDGRIDILTEQQYAVDIGKTAESAAMAEQEKAGEI